MYVKTLLWTGLFFAFGFGYAQAAPKAGHVFHKVFHKHHKHAKAAIVNGGGESKKKSKAAK